MIALNNLQYLRDFIRRRSAIVVEADKDYLIEARLEPLARKLGFRSIDDLVNTLRANEATPTAHAVIEAMTTNETSFFRDAHPFEALTTNIVPRLMESRGYTRQLRIWCAAASSGQEPYSIAMALREALPSLANWDVQILATDLNKTVLERARTGLYKDLEVRRGLPPSLLAKYFERVGADWRIRQEIRQMVRFQELNLLDRWPLFSAQDVIFIRNVLIYFDMPTKRQLLGRARDALREDGTLILGGGETTANLDEEYAAVRIGSGVYYQPKPGSDSFGKLVAHAAR